MSQADINFKLTPSEKEKITAIVDRARDLYLKHSPKKTFDAVSVRMDLIAVHNHGCKLDLEGLKKADDFNLAHDVFGIVRHIDRDTGKLTDFFLPRFARKQNRPAA